jgi:hypothetical protein
MNEPRLLASSFNRPNISYRVAYVDVAAQQALAAGQDAEGTKYSLLLDAIKAAGQGALLPLLGWAGPPGTGAACAGAVPRGVEWTGGARAACQ